MRQGPIQGEPVLDRHIPLRDGDEARKPRLRGEQIVVVRVHLVGAQVVSDEEVTNLCVVEQPEVHAQHLALRHPGQVRKILFQPLQAPRSRAHGLLQGVEPLGDWAGDLLVPQPRTQPLTRLGDPRRHLLAMSREPLQRGRGREQPGHPGTEGLELFRRGVRVGKLWQRVEHGQPGRERRQLVAHRADLLLHPRKPQPHLAKDLEVQRLPQIGHPLQQDPLQLGALLLDPGQPAEPGLRAHACRTGQRVQLLRPLLQTTEGRDPRRAAQAREALAKQGRRIRKARPPLPAQHGSPSQLLAGHGEGQQGGCQVAAIHCRDVARRKRLQGARVGPVQQVTAVVLEPGHGPQGVA